jgi:putative nucleotidyltransferase with HDIG domain
MLKEKDLSFIDKIDEISSVPSIILDLMSMLNDSSANINTIVEKIKLDPGMVSFVLKTCNSPLYGIRNKVSSINVAVNLLGYMNLKSILMAFFTKNLYSMSGKNEILNTLWKHSIGVAVIAKHLSNKFRFKDDETYVGGLLHDIGKLILFKYDPKRFEEVFFMAQSGKSTFMEAENQIFNINHLECGYYLMEKWDFSEFLRNTVMYHHDFDSFMDIDVIFGLVPFANLLMHNLFENGNYDLQYFISRYGISGERLDEINREVIPIVQEHHSSL